MAMTIPERAKSVANHLRIYTRSVFIDDVEAAVLKALREQDRDTRHACAEAVTKLSASIAEANTYRGKVNLNALEICFQMDLAAQACMNINTEANHGQENKQS